MLVDVLNVCDIDAYEICLNVEYHKYCKNKKINKNTNCVIRSKDNINLGQSKK